jgi:hypothetical protein
MSKNSKNPPASAAAPVKATAPAPDLSATLASLRATRTQLYAIPGATVAAMSSRPSVRRARSCTRFPARPSPR